MPLLNIKKEGTKTKVVKDEKKSLRLFSFVKRERSLGTILLKNFAVFLVGVIFFAGTLYFESISINAADSKGLKEAVLLVQENYSIDLEKNQEKSKISSPVRLVGEEIIYTEGAPNTVLSLSDRGEIRLSNNTILEVNLLNPYTNQYELTLRQGRIWVNTQFSDFNIKIKSGNFSLIPGFSSVDINYDGSITTVYSDTNDTKVEIMNNGDFLNSFYIAEGFQAKLSDSKVNKEARTIAVLLYSKLIKEFNYGKLSSSKIESDTWINEQIKNDRQLKESLNALFEDLITRQGLKAVSTDSVRYKFKETMSGIRHTLTFSSDKKIDQILDSMFENLHDAEFLYLSGEVTNADIRLSLFKDDVISQSNTQTEEFKEEFYTRIKNEFDHLLTIYPDNQMYPVKSEFITLLTGDLRSFSETEKLFNYLTIKFNDLFNSASSYSVKTAKQLDEYFALYNKIVQRYRDKMPSIKNEIERQNTLVDNLIISYWNVQTIDTFKQKHKMEDDYLLAFESQIDKQEQRQTFISNKIDLLNRIKIYVFNDQITVDEALQNIFIIFDRIEELQTGTLSTAAVNELFDKRMQDFGIFFKYLNTPEYSKEILHGSTHKERYEKFEKVVEEIFSFEDIREEILGEDEQQVEITAQSILEDAEKDLKAEKFTNIEFGFYEDPDSTKIPIVSAEIQGVVFRAVYDWDRKLISNIIVNDNLISQSGVKLENAGKYILEAISVQSAVVVTPDIEDTQEPETDPQENIMNAAKVFLIGKFSKTGMMIFKNNITIVDFDNGIYEVRNVFYEENPDIEISFQYSTKDDVITKLVAKHKELDKVVSKKEEFSFTFLKNFVLSLFEEE